MPRRKASNKMIEFVVDVVVEPDDDQYHAYCPALRGLHVGGLTQDEAIRNAVDAVELYLVSLVKHGDPIPLGVVVESSSAAAKRRHVHHMERFAVSFDEFQAAHISL
jgi:predicted RNase H-like HicB family nuclease